MHTTYCRVYQYLPSQTILALTLLKVAKSVISLSPNLNCYIEIGNILSLTQALEDLANATINDYSLNLASKNIKNRHTKSHTTHVKYLVNICKLKL